MMCRLGLHFIGFRTGSWQQRRFCNLYHRNYNWKPQSQQQTRSSIWKKRKTRAGTTISEQHCSRPTEVPPWMICCNTGSGSRNRQWRSAHPGDGKSDYIQLLLFPISAHPSPSQPSANDETFCGRRLSKRFSRSMHRYSSRRITNDMTLPMRSTR